MKIQKRNTSLLSSPKFWESVQERARARKNHELRVWREAFTFSQRLNGQSGTEPLIRAAQATQFYQNQLAKVEQKPLALFVDWGITPICPMCSGTGFITEKVDIETSFDFGAGSSSIDHVCPTCGLGAV